MSFSGVVERTVHCDRHRLRQNVAIGPNEGGDASQRIQLQIVRADIRRPGLYQLKLEVVGLGDSQNSCRAGIVLIAPKRQLNCGAHIGQASIVKWRTVKP